jgi:hypothetical protein
MNRYCGAILEYYSNNNVFTKNNFISNYKNMGFNAFLFKSFRNKWSNNYWDDWIGINSSLNYLPKIIYGTLFENSRHKLLLNFDWNPAQKIF